jgi:hypothetical protein
MEKLKNRKMEEWNGKWLNEMKNSLLNVHHSCTFFIYNLIHSLSIPQFFHSFYSPRLRSGYRPRLKLLVERSRDESLMCISTPQLEENIKNGRMLEWRNWEMEEWNEKWRMYINDEHTIKFFFISLAHLPFHSSIFRFFNFPILTFHLSLIILRFQFNFSHPGLWPPLYIEGNEESHPALRAPLVRGEYHDSQTHRVDIILSTLELLNLYR